ncbi:PREDICTED: inorganic pyrophosphatase-like [Amphimedon queenslandica]|uniref:Inorganic pyrophosphatase n=1 Tax=Amphimedon queenslandica TaxID=400682 RepID=A0A1X7UFT5_AMPQE|nr:PREDICTED: inorganic pyrophosphatase-like [Amphimedon queenslandica]|eukprot:XP_003388041.1 PREDICTED: inorganic pyrophosphatase-like [Amphimedon queenslandica]
MNFCLSRILSPFKRGSSSKLLISAAVRPMATFTTEERGKGRPYSLESRIFFKRGDTYVSPFHDIPLYASSDNSVLNMIVEIPRWTNAKMEISTSEPLNPIKQDVKKGKLRFVDNCFPYHGYIWNYGAFPQTWEYPGHVDPNTGCKGDNDPLDVCEIGSRVAKRGEVVQVKVLGTIALIDEGETDWKIIAIDVNDKMAASLNDIGDVETHMPGLLQHTVNWFKIYKMPTGKPPNQFAFNAQPKDKAFAHNVISTTNQQWRSAIDGNTDKGSLCLSNITLSSSDTISNEAAAGIVNGIPVESTHSQDRPDTVDLQHYVKI